MSVALTGEFQLRKAPHAEPELYGRIEPVPNRGYVEQFARSFDITGGEVLLNGKMKDHTGRHPGAVQAADQLRVDRVRRSP